MEPNKVCKIIVACCVLHNMAIKANLPLDQIDINDDDDFQLPEQQARNINGLRARAAVFRIFF